MTLYKLWQHINSCRYQLTVVGDNDNYYDHYYDGHDHYKFGGHDHYGLIEIDWACVWDTDKYVPVPLPHSFYIYVEQWEENGSPSKVRLATKDEIKAANDAAMKEHLSRRFKASYNRNSRKACWNRRNEIPQTFWGFGSENMPSEEAVLNTLSRVHHGKFSKEGFRKSLEELECYLCITEEYYPRPHCRMSIDRRATPKETDIILKHAKAAYLLTFIGI